MNRRSRADAIDRLNLRRGGMRTLRQRPERRSQRDRLEPLCRWLVVPAKTIVVVTDVLLQPAPAVTIVRALVCAMTVAKMTDLIG